MEKSPLQIAIFGMPGSVFTERAMRALLEGISASQSEVQLRYLVLPHRPRPAQTFPVPVEVHEPLIELANTHGVACLAYHHENSAALLSSWQSAPPDLVIVACFPYRLSETLLESIKYGGWNIHPSLLPAYRGPDPLFWQLRDGASRYGISLHQMTDTLDQGLVYCQREIELSVEQFRRIDARLAELSGECLTECLLRLLDNSLQTIPTPEERQMSYQSFPKGSDCSCADTLPAWTAYAFFKRALMYSPHVSLQTLNMEIRFSGIHDFHIDQYPKAVQRENNFLHIRMQQGSLVIRISDVINQDELGII